MSAKVCLYAHDYHWNWLRIKLQYAHTFARTNAHAISYWLPIFCLSVCFHFNLRFEARKKPKQKVSMTHFVCNMPALWKWLYSVVTYYGNWCYLIAKYIKICIRPALDLSTSNLMHWIPFSKLAHSKRRYRQLVKIARIFISHNCSMFDAFIQRFCSLCSAIVTYFFHVLSSEFFEPSFFFFTLRIFFLSSDDCFLFVLMFFSLDEETMLPWATSDTSQNEMFTLSAENAFTRQWNMFWYEFLVSS